MRAQPGCAAIKRATAALRGKPVRIYVGDKDSLFHELAQEQFGHSGTVMSPSGCGGVKALCPSKLVRALYRQNAGRAENCRLDWGGNKQALWEFCRISGSR